MEAPQQKSNREHSFDAELASFVGIEKAILLKNIDYWVTENERRKIDSSFAYGKWWTFESLTSLAKKYPYMKRGNLSRWFKELKESKWIIMYSTTDGANMYRPGPVFTSWDLGQDWQVVFQNETGKTWGGVFQNEPKAVFQNETEGAAHFETDNNVEKHIEKNVEREGEREAENTPSPPKDFDEMIKRVNAEVATIEAEKEKNTPVPAAPSLAPTHVVTTVDGQKLPGALVATIEGLNLEQTTRETAAEALTRRISNPLADNAIDAGKLIEVWCAENSETVKWAYEAARRKLTPDDLSARIIDFCGCYANSVEPGKQVLFFGDPARMFKNGLTKWLQTQNKFDRDQAAKPNTGKFQQQDNAAAYVAPKAVRPVQTFYE